ncbi:MAG: hypothetical protein LQ342_001654 [Letrouitia transgressa]|nr:MAG: hypothetical protein LQ342_001654 [Letrouitia transgressa]
MATEAADLTKIDSAISGLSSSPPDKKGHRRASSSAAGVYNINDLGAVYQGYLDSKLTTGLEKEGKELQIAKETQKINWYLPSSRPHRVEKLNTSPATLEDKETLKKFLTNPPVKKIDLHFPLGLEVTARNLKGVTIKDALDAIHKQFKKKADDELENPILAGFEWDKEESWTRLIVHQKKEGAPSSSKKKNKKEIYDD